MPIISNPRQIRIDLDPDLGFAVGFSIESARRVDENGVTLSDLGPHIEAVQADHPLVAATLADLNAANATALLTYQAEVQRLAGEVEALKAQLAAATPAP